jgi:hypothetical protein
MRRPLLTKHNLRDLRVSVSEAKQLGLRRRPSLPEKENHTTTRMSAGDAKLLVQLARKYGPAFIALAVQDIPDEVLARGRGRPIATIEQPYLRKMHLADCIEEWAEEHRAAGSRKPYDDAYFDLYKIRYGHDLIAAEKQRPFAKFQKATKKDHYEGRQYWRGYAYHLREQPNRMFDLPYWLQRRLAGRK